MTQESEELPESASNKISLVNVLAGVIVSPKSVFGTLVGKPVVHSHWAIPIVFGILLGILHSTFLFVNEPLRETLKTTQLKIVEKQIEKGMIPPEDREERESIIIDYIDKGVYAKANSMLAAIAGGAYLFGISFAVWVLCRIIFQTTLPYAKVMEFVGLASVISVIGAIINLVLIWGTGNLFANVGPALFISDFDPTNKSHALQYGMDFATVWLLAVLSLGVSLLVERPVRNVAIWLFGAWIVMKFGGVLAAL